MTLETVALVALLAALAVLALFTVLRLAATIRRGRALVRFQRAAAGLASNLAREGDPLIRDIEEVRRRSADPSVAQARLATALPALRAISAQSRAGLDVPRGLEPLAAALAGEAARAVRSAEMAEAGLDALLDRRSRRETEAATALKRASLNMRNAIDEAARLGQRIGRLRPADLDRPASIAGAVATSSLPSYGSTEDDLPIGS